MRKFLNYNSIAVVFAVFSLLGFALPTSALAAGPAAINLGTAGNFRILAKTLVSDANPVVSSIGGNVGVSPAAGSSITGLSCTEVTGNIYDVDGTYTGGHDSNVACLLPGPGANKTLVDNAVLDMGTAYTNASAPATPAGVGANLDVGSGTLSGQDFAPGTYTWGTAVTITGDITLTGSASDVWVFQVTGTLDISANKKIILAGGALASNVFWQVTGAVTLQPGSHFEGNILAQTNIAMQAGASLSGRALAQTAVTLIGNSISGSSPALCADPAATNLGGALPCTYPPAPTPTPAAPAPVNGNSQNSGRGGGGSQAPSTVTTVTSVPNLPNTGSAPGLPNTGFAPQVIMSFPWNILTLVIVALLLVVGIVWKKRNV